MRRGSMTTGDMGSDVDTENAHPGPPTGSNSRSSRIMLLAAIADDVDLTPRTPERGLKRMQSQG